ncbi:MAG TPA: YebC/PmpR family DNA-binding transcriptional regulator [Gammaproteobacteria bacterium]|nr:YebC/PmpR family DNA-binding transcriptional regulator [Gammaproteobacteria bacterium]
MAGHSKWANIKFRKEKQDSKRGKLFTKLIREITVAAGIGGADAGSNPRLRKALDKAWAANMTKDVIDRAIKRGAGGEGEANMEEINYEGYGPGGVAVMVECLSNNRNRTVSEVRHAFTKYGGNLGTNGSVSYLFSSVGQIMVEGSKDLEKIMELAIESGANDVDSEDGENVMIECSPENFNGIKDALEKAKYKLGMAEIAQVASTEVRLDAEDSERVLKLIDALEDLDDVQSVYTNADLAEEVLSRN